MALRGRISIEVLGDRVRAKGGASGSWFSPRSKKNPADPA
jgi:hypothetical protein